MKIEGRKAFILKEKLKGIKTKLKQSNKEVYGDIGRNIQKPNDFPTYYK